MKRNVSKLLLGSTLLLGMLLTGCNTPTVPSGDTSQDDTSEGESTAKKVTGISLNQEELSLTVGGTFTLVATITPSKADNKNITWTSSNVDVASINEGLITALSVGETTITVTTEDGGFTASCKVNVLAAPVAVTGVELNYNEYTLKVGKQITLQERLVPSNATNHNVTWTSSDETIATVENGTVLAKAAGSATIEVKTEDGEYTATCEVTVVEDTDDTYDPIGLEDVIIITAPNPDDSKGEYSFSGELNKQIYVNAPGEEIVLNFNGVTINYGENSPIYVKSCDSIDISAKKGSTNVINDNREAMESESDDQGKGAIYVADGDLKLKGAGTLSINANYNNGIHGKDDVKIQKMTLNVAAPNNAIKGNDSVTILSGTINISCGNDGIKTENSDISSKGNQRGDITIEGGTIVANSIGDALAASHDVIIEEALDETTSEVLAPISITAKTDKYSSYSGDTLTKEDDKFYIRMTETYYNSYGSKYRFSAYINENWYDAIYVGTKKFSLTGSSSGGGYWMSTRPGPGGGGQQSSSTTYYMFEIEKPTDATSFALYMFNSGASNSLTSYVAKGTATFSSAYDIITLSSLSTSSKSMSLGNWTSDDPSKKAIKAENAIYIKSGTVNVESVDDGIHCNGNGVLENGETPLGNIYISGGNITVKTDDDGIHAGNTLSISGGEINVSKSYEGLEGTIINISGGTSYVTASDDGVNAGDGDVASQITVSGGYLDVSVSSSGDVDGIDSNGTYTQTGGVVITKGPASGGAASLDTDGAVTIKGGTLVVFGSIERTPSYSGVTKTSNSNTYSSGTKTIKFSGSTTTYSTTLSYSYRGLNAYSELGTVTIA